MSKINEVNYVRRATRARDNRKGFLYIHRWDTGNQYLTFHAHEHAETFSKTLAHGSYKGPVRGQK